MGDSRNMNQNTNRSTDRTPQHNDEEVSHTRNYLGNQLGTVWKDGKKFEKDFVKSVHDGGTFLKNVGKGNIGAVCGDLVNMVENGYHVYKDGQKFKNDFEHIEKNVEEGVNYFQQTLSDTERKEPTNMNQHINQHQ